MKVAGMFCAGEQSLSVCFQFLTLTKYIRIIPQIGLKAPQTRPHVLRVAKSNEKQ